MLHVFMRSRHWLPCAALFCAVAIVSACSRAPEVSSGAEAGESDRSASRRDAPAAAESAAPSATPGTAGVSAASSESSVRVFVDPTTGEIREPTDAEAAAVAKEEQSQAAITKPGATDRAQEVRLPDGSTAVILDRSDSQYLEGCLKVDGSVTVDHDCDKPGKDEGNRR